MLTQAPRGTKDVSPKESYKWQFLENSIREKCRLGGYREIRTPVFEHTELFLRSVGDTTDVVQKEMYTFNDKGGRSITLKPEGTAGAVRAYLENGIFNDSAPTKMYYLNCPVFRYENPQSGRLREHHQFGVEVFGAQKATCDADVIALALNVVEAAGITGETVHINTIGCPKCRPEYVASLRQHLLPIREKLCKTCQDRFDRNPLRILDCKDPDCQTAIASLGPTPTMLDSLCPECETHFEQLKRSLQTLKIEYVIDPKIVRGLDYYTKTVFEIITDVDGSPMTITGGGRYDGLVETVGGPATPGVGFGMGLERILLVLEKQNVQIPEPRLLDCYIASMGEDEGSLAFQLSQRLRKEGVAADCDQVGRSFKAQFKYAGRIGVPFVAVIGSEEMERGVVKLRDMRGGDEILLPPDQIAAYILQKL